MLCSLALVISCWSGRSVAQSQALNPHIEPSLDAARRNAFQIFNAVHSAMRQWGSSVNHNGMSYFLATVPEDNLFYHGSRTPGPPKHFEWLAFEFEHSFGFAQSWDGPRRIYEPPKAMSPLDVQRLQSEIRGAHTLRKQTSQFASNDVTQQRLGSSFGDIHDSGFELPWNPPPTMPFHPGRGYFHTYRATRPLKLIYIDGEGAAKCNLGTLDTQDVILLGADDGQGMSGELYRAQTLCLLAKKWGIDGWIRMEAGFEIIYCDFSPGAGLELVFSHGMPFPNETESPWNDGMVQMFEWVRAVAQRYHGMAKGRIDVDWSSMVTAFAYNVNLTNPNPERQDLPRALGMTAREKESIRNRVGDVVEARVNSSSPPVDWQSIVDQIVSRFSTRIGSLALSNLTLHSGLFHTMEDQIRILTDPFFSCPEDKHRVAPRPESVLACTNHYLAHAVKQRDTWTTEDRVIFTAIKAVSDIICSSLFDIRRVLFSASEGQEEAALAKTRQIAVDLMRQLRWSIWKECRGCQGPDEVCFIPMFPFGSREDYFSPNCKSADGPWTMGYWFSR